MSKASEWAKAQSIKPDEFKPRGTNFRADVDEAGRLAITVTGMQLRYETSYLTRDAALALAAWIIDTFGEADGEGR